MIENISINNYALIDHTHIELEKGFSVITGETGAGKSILLGSMQLILGGKTSRSMIRENAPYALVELLFQVENTKAKEALAALDTQILVDNVFFLDFAGNRTNRAVSCA